MLIDRIISGGQTGADIAGLKAAKACNIPTGGYIPKGYKTQDGPKPEYRSLYGLTALDSSSYRVRTYRNVKESDVTIRFATKWDSHGEICTANALKHHSKPCIDIFVPHLSSPVYYKELVGITAIEIERKDYKIINIAGNSEITCPGIENAVQAFLSDMFKYMGHGIT